MIFLSIYFTSVFFCFMDGIFFRDINASIGRIYTLTQKEQMPVTEAEVSLYFRLVLIGGALCPIVNTFALAASVMRQCQAYNFETLFKRKLS